MKCVSIIINCFNHQSKLMLHTIALFIKDLNSLLKMHYFHNNYTSGKSRFYESLQWHTKLKVHAIKIFVC